MNLASQLQSASANYFQIKADKLASLLPHQIEAMEKRAKISAAVTKVKKTAEEIAMEVEMPINYVQKVLGEREDEWCLSKHRIGNNVPYKWWRE